MIEKWQIKNKLKITTITEQQGKKSSWMLVNHVSVLQSTEYFSVGWSDGVALAELVQHYVLLGSCIFLMLLH